MSVLGDRLAVSLISLHRIGRRLQASLDENGGIFPISADRVRDDEGTVAVTRDAFLQRFQQAADHILRKLFPRTLAAIEGSAEFLPIRDLLDGLDRAGLIDTVEPWLTLIELRNRLIHDYALSDAELADDLNAAWRMAPDFLRQITRIRDYADLHSLLDGASINEQ